jgi:hypothetical protein
MPQLGTTSYLGPWIQMLSNNVAQYLGSTNAPPKQKESIFLVKVENIAEQLEEQ